MTRYLASKFSAVAFLIVLGCTLQPTCGDDHVIDIRSISGFGREFRCVAFDPAGRRIIAGGANRTLSLWDASSGGELWAVRDRDAVIAALAFSPDGRRLATCEAKRFVAVREGAVAFVEGHAGFIGRSFPQPTAYLLRVRDTSDGSELHTLQVEDGKHFAEAIVVTQSAIIALYGESSTLRCWDYSSGQLLFSKRFKKDRPYAYLSHLALSSNANRIAWTEHVDGHTPLNPIERDLQARDDFSLNVWGISAKQTTILTTGINPIQSIAITRDGSRAVSGDVDHRLTLWNLETGNVVRSFKADTSDNPLFLTFNPDGSRFLSATKDGYLREWECSSGVRLRSIRGPRGRIRAVSFLADRLRVASGGYDRLEERDPNTGDFKTEPLLVWDVSIYPTP